MKRFRITARDEPRKLKLFKSSEALFAWSVGDGVDNSELVEITVRLDDYLDVELIGFEYVNDGKTLQCFNLVNVAFAHATENDTGHTITSRLCWVSDAVFPMREVTDGTLTIRRLSDDEGIKLQHPLAPVDDE